MAGKVVHFKFLEAVKRKILAYIVFFSGYLGIGRYNELFG